MASPLEGTTHSEVSHPPSVKPLWEGLHKHTERFPFWMTLILIKLAIRTSQHGSHDGLNPTTCKLFLLGVPISDAKGTNRLGPAAFGRTNTASPKPLHNLSRL